VVLGGSPPGLSFFLPSFGPNLRAGFCGARMEKPPPAEHGDLSGERHYQASGGVGFVGALFRKSGARKAERERFMESPSKPANELEGLIRDKLPDPVRRHLIDVMRTDADGLAPNWTAQPVWSHEVSSNDKREFISALFEVLRDYDLLTHD
jgi:hypothetical protein